MSEAPAAVAAAERAATPDRPWRRRLWRLLAVAFGLALVTALGWALLRQDWSVVTVVLRQRGPWEIALLLGGAVLASTLSLGFGLAAWRVVLLELGPPVPNAGLVRIWLVGFLSKYVPGKVPGLLATVKVAQTSGVTFGRLASTWALSTSLVVLTGLTVGLLVGVPVLGANVAWLAVAAAVTAVVVVWPGLVNRAAALVLRLLRRPAPTGRVSARGVRLSVGWQTLSWLVSGVHLWLLAVAMDAPPARALPLCVGAFAVATVVGLLAVVMPDGIGVREAVLLAALTAVLPVPSAAVVALTSRLVSTVSEVVVGGAALAVTEVLHRRGSVSGRREEDRRQAVCQS